MGLDSNDYIESYIKWLRSNIHTKVIGEYTEITTPFLDRRNDHLQIYVKQCEDIILLTDDGYIINDLEMSGCAIDSPRRKNVLITMLNALGVKLDKDALVVEARSDNFAQKKHALLQAMISVNDMFMLSKQSVSSLFLEDVEMLLDQHDIRYTPSIQVTGKSGFIHTFDFVIPASKKKPERLIRALNKPTKDKAQSVLFTWGDTKDVRRHESSMFVFLNDMDNPIRSDIISAFSEYNIKTIPWTKKETYIEELCA